MRVTPPPTPPDDPVRPDSLPHSRGAQARFLARLPSAPTEGFESLPVGILTQFTLNGETVTIDGVAQVMSQAVGTFNGTYPTEGERFLLSSNNGPSFTLVFSSPQAALGFMGTDIGDGGAPLLLEFHRTDGTTQHLTVPNSTSASGSMPNISGSALFFGALEAGAAALQRTAGIPSVTVYTVEALIDRWTQSAGAISADFVTNQKE